MTKVLLAVCLVVACGMAASAFAVGPISLGFHLIPSIEPQQGHRIWDLSMSLGVVLSVTPEDSLELTGMIDSAPSALGATVAYHRAVTPSVSLGAGVTALWPMSASAGLSAPLFESFARAAIRGELTGGITTEVAASLPVLTVAQKADRWTLMPLAELPSLSVTGDIHLVGPASLGFQLTLQPVIMDTTTLVDPFGRVADDLLILPTLSAFLRYGP